MIVGGLGSIIECVSIEDIGREGIWTKGVGITKVGEYVTCTCTPLVAWV